MSVPEAALERVPRGTVVALCLVDNPVRYHLATLCIHILKEGSKKYCNAVALGYTEGINKGAHIMIKPSEVTLEQVLNHLSTYGRVRKLNYKANGEDVYMVRGCTYPASRLIDERAGVVADALNRKA